MCSCARLTHIFVGAATTYFKSEGGKTSDTVPSTFISSFGSGTSWLSEHCATCFRVLGQKFQLEFWRVNNEQSNGKDTSDRVALEEGIVQDSLFFFFF